MDSFEDTPPRYEARNETPKCKSVVTGIVSSKRKMKATFKERSLDRIIVCKHHFFTSSRASIVTGLVKEESNDMKM